LTIFLIIFYRQIRIQKRHQDDNYDQEQDDFDAIIDEEIQGCSEMLALIHQQKIIGESVGYAFESSEHVERKENKNDDLSLYTFFDVKCNTFNHRLKIERKLV
jgi:hypothetical protein